MSVRKSILAAISFGGTFLNAKAVPTYGQSARCTSHDVSCWPSASDWSSFNQSVSGRLVASHPSAAVCHYPLYDEGQCAIARQNWTDSVWRTNQAGGYSAILWEEGDQVCSLNGSVASSCGQGRVAQYSVTAKEISDIQKAVKFASKKSLYLVIKNTGHDHLGRSSGDGSFAIWTHNMKGRQWLDSFVPENAPAQITGVPAVTLQAGEQWFDVYRDAQAHNVTIVGGSARTVGAAGGYLTGGGHSPFAHFYGLAADNLLEVKIVTPAGEAKTLNPYSDADYFWALRGGGGSAWGVITSVTYKTHPLPAYIQAALVQINVTENSARRPLLTKCLSALPQVAESGYTGYIDAANGFQAIFSQANGTNETLAKAFAPFYEAANMTGVSGQIAAAPLFPTFLDYGQYFLRDPNIATNVIDASRLLTAEVLKNKTGDLIDLVEQFPDLTPGFNFVGKVNPAERAKTAVHPIWAESVALFSFSADFADDAPAAEKKQKKQRLQEVSRRLEQIVGPEGGTYMNEANPYEPYWQEAFWGSNYKKLLQIKKRIDPQNLFVCNRCVGAGIVLEP